MSRDPKTYRAARRNIARIIRKKNQRKQRTLLKDYMPSLQALVYQKKDH